MYVYIQCVSIDFLHVYLLTYLYMIYLSQSDGHTNRYGDATDIEYSSSIAGWTAMDNVDRGQHHQQQEQEETEESEQQQQHNLFFFIFIVIFVLDASIVETASWQKLTNNKSFFWCHADEADDALMLMSLMSIHLISSSDWDERRKLHGLQLLTLQTLAEWVPQRTSIESTATEGLGVLSVLRLYWVAPTLKCLWVARDLHVLATGCHLDPLILNGHEAHATKWAAHQGPMQAGCFLRLYLLCCVEHLSTHVYSTGPPAPVPSEPQSRQKLVKDGGTRCVDSLRFVWDFTKCA